MKTRLFLLAGILIATITSGQNNELKETISIQPSLKSDVSGSIQAYITERAVYPAAETKWGYQGTVVVKFLVTTEGKLNDMEIINGLSYAIDNEVIRLLKSTDGKWTPGTVNGKAVDMPNEVSVVFKLYPDDNFVERAKKYLQKGNYVLLEKNKPAKALKYFNREINYLPNDEILLSMRGLCKYKLGDETGATRDLRRAHPDLEFKGIGELINNLEYLRDYAELLQKNQE